MPVEFDRCHKIDFIVTAKTMPVGIAHYYNFKPCKSELKLWHYNKRNRTRRFMKWFAINETVWAFLNQHGLFVNGI